MTATGSHNTIGHAGSQQRLEYLDSLRALAVFMVVGIHTTAYCLPLSAAEYQVISFIVHTAAVPIFYLTDGFLFAFKQRGSINFAYTIFIKKSARRLLLPWLIFSLLYAVIRALFEMAGLLDKRVLLDSSLFEITVILYGSVVASHLYFLPALFIIRLFSIIIHPLIQLPKGSVLLLCLAYIVLYNTASDSLVAILHIEGGHEPLLHALYGLQFYALGIALCLFRDTFAKHLLPTALTALFLSTLIHFSFNGFFDNIFSKYLMILGLYFFFLQCDICNGPLRRIGQNTMGIYLIHSPIIVKAVSIGVNPFLQSPLISYLTILLLVFFLSLAATLVLREFSFGRFMMGLPPKRAAKPS